MLYPLINGECTHCNSTRELINEFERVNEGIVENNWIVGSLDIDALYPSLDIERYDKCIKRNYLIVR